MTELTATETARAIAEGRLGALEACDAAIARIERTHAALNAIVVPDFERAREQARECDRQRAAGQRLPLLGVPMTVKESFDVAGLPTTWGLPMFQAYRAARDAVAVQRLKAAGAVILGKSNIATMLADWQASNPVYGRTNHPLDPTRTPGGSSGGAAAAVTAGLVPLELGSDIGGSIRVPAAFCGVFGHKPTWELIPQRGHTVAGQDGAPTDLAVVGPLARTADDLRLALQVLAGPDTIDAAGLRLQLPPPRPRHLGECRLLVLAEHPRCPTNRLMQASVARVAALAAQAGAQVATASDRLPDLASAFDVYAELLTTVTTQGMPGAKPIDAHRWLGLKHRQARLQREWQRLFESFDAVVTPAFGREAYAHQVAPNPEHELMDIDGQATVYGLQVGWPGVATLPGLPATAAPVGRSDEGLPVGLQVIGPAYGDLATIAIADWLAQAAAAGR